MTMNGNHLSFEGNLVNRTDPSQPGKAPLLELITATNGTKYARFSLARSYTKAGAQVTDFLDCVVFGSTAENMVDSVEQGARLSIEGHISQSNWETPDGQKRSKIEAVVDSVAVNLRWATAIVEKNAKDPEPTPTLALVPDADVPVDAELVEVAF